MKKLDYLQMNQHMIKDKIVLDLACHDGQSTAIIQSLGASHVYAIDIRRHLIDQAKKKIPTGVDFYTGDITDPSLTDALVNQSQTIIMLGVFYHLFDHFRFLSNVLKPNIEHCLIETVCGPETLNPEMFWGFEKTDHDRHGFFQNYDRVPFGVPNTAWIVEAAKIFGFECDWIHYYGTRQKKTLTNITMEEYHNVAGPDWPAYEQLILNQNIPAFVQQELENKLYEFTSKRMILRLYNNQKVHSTALSIKDIFYWPL